MGFCCISTKNRTDDDVDFEIAQNEKVNLGYEIL